MVFQVSSLLKTLTRMWLALAALALCDSQVLCADDCGPRTLMQWSGGGYVDSEPPLSEPLITDRPDFTEASTTVGRGVAQLEAGYTYTYDDTSEGKVSEHSFPEALLRVGVLADWLELRVGWNYGQSAETVFGAGDENLEGAEDLYLGIKLALTPQEYWLPETATIVQMNVPSGSSDFTAHEVLPGVSYLYSWDVSDFFAMGGSTQANRAIDDNGQEYYVEFAQSFTTGYSLGEKLGSYAEWFMFAPCSAETARNQQYFNAGFTYQFTDNFQWDIRAGVGLNEEADDFFTGTGFAVRR